MIDGTCSACYFFPAIAALSFFPNVPPRCPRAVSRFDVLVGAGIRCLADARPERGQWDQLRARGAGSYTHYFKVVGLG